MENQYRQISGRASPAKATGTITVTNYAQLHLTKAALVSQLVTYTAKTAGTAANAYTVTVIDTTAGGLTFTNVTGVITIDLGGSTSYANDVATLMAATTLVDVTGTDLATPLATHAVEHLAGGYNASTVTVNGKVLTESVEYNATVSDNQTATNIAAAITTATATTLSTAVASTSVVTITANAYGTATITLATSDAVNLTKSAVTLTGGSTESVLVSGADLVVRLISAHIFIITAAVGGGGLVQLKNGSTVLWQATANVIAQHDIDFHDGLGYPMTVATDLKVVVSGGVTSNAVVLVLATGFLTGV